MKILIVDDDTRIRNALRRLLQRQLLPDLLLEANNGVEGLELLKGAREPFDLIITDQDMPQMKGDLMIAQAIESRCLHIDRTAVIHLSGGHPRGTVIGSQGLIDVVRVDKPFEPEGFIPLIRSELAKRASTT